MLKTKITPDLLLTYLRADMNILIAGHHGLGKTACMKAACDQEFGDLNVDYLYFSCATMDPFLDFKGIPNRVKDENGDYYMSLVLPKLLRDGKIKHIIFDELNRAPDAVINGVMELIQFKSINGHRFENLRSVSAMVNPTEEDDDTESNLIYSVNQLDPAHKDRFQIHLEAEYAADTEFFKEVYGHTGEAAAMQWNKLSDKNKSLFSPRRLEAAVQLFIKGINFEHCTIPAQVNPVLFREAMEGASRKQQLEELLKEGDDSAIFEFMNNDSNYYHITSMIEAAPTKLLHHLSDERISSMIKNHKSMFDYAATAGSKHKNIQRVFSLIKKSTLDQEHQLFSDPSLSAFNFHKLYEKYMGTPGSFEMSDEQKAAGMDSTHAFEEYADSRRKALGIVINYDDVE